MKRCVRARRLWKKHGFVSGNEKKTLHREWLYRLVVRRAFEFNLCLWQILREFGQERICCASKTDTTNFGRGPLSNERAYEPIRRYRLGVEEHNGRLGFMRHEPGGRWGWTGRSKWPWPQRRGWRWSPLTGWTRCSRPRCSKAFSSPRPLWNGNKINVNNHHHVYK